ncbi:unnamed protein product [Brassica rapa subsp. trilocularis]
MHWYVRTISHYFIKKIYFRDLSSEYHFLPKFLISFFSSKSKYIFTCSSRGYSRFQKNKNSILEFLLFCYITSGEERDI